MYASQHPFMPPSQSMSSSSSSSTSVWANVHAGVAQWQAQHMAALDMLARRLQERIAATMIVNTVDAERLNELSPPTVATTEVQADPDASIPVKMEDL